MPEKVDILSVVAAPRAPSSVVGWRGSRPVTHEEFLARVLAWSAMLRRTPGQAFALYLGDSIEFAGALYGAWYAGKTIYLPGDKLPATCASLRRSVDGYLGEFEPESKSLTPNSEDTAALDEISGHLSSDFPGLVIYTSGSTGTAQAIPKKLSQLSSEVATLEKQFGHLLGDAEILATVSHQHIYGLLFKVLWPLAAGRAVQTRSLSFFDKLASTQKLRDGVWVSTPAHLKRLPDDISQGIASRVARAVFCSGGPLPLDVAQESARIFGVTPIEVYGSSETGGIAWRRQTANDDRWTPFPGVTWRIHEREGVLEIRSPNLPNEEWFCTADRATPVDRHRFTLHGRIDRIVKIEEKRVSLTAIEQALIASPMVSDARVLATNGTRQRIAAFIVPSAAGNEKLAAIGKLAFNRMLRALLTQSIEPVGLPRIWRYLDILPVDSQGKITHAALLGMLKGTSAVPILPHGRMLEAGANRAVFELTAPKALLYFDGHFPDMPILPGVTQVDWVIFYARQCFELPATFRGIHALKFHRVISPEMPFRLELLHEPAESSLSFKITSTVGAHASGRIVFGAGNV